MKGARASKDIAAAEKQISESAVAKVLKLPHDDPLNERVEEVIKLGTTQREDLREMLDLIKQHVSDHFGNSGGPALLDKLPRTDPNTALAVSSDEALKCVKSFLDLAEKKVQEAPREGRRHHREHRNHGRGGRDEPAHLRASKASRMIMSTLDQGHLRRRKHPQDSLHLRVSHPQSILITLITQMVQPDDYEYSRSR